MVDMAAVVVVAMGGVVEGGVDTEMAVMGVVVMDEVATGVGVDMVEVEVEVVGEQHCHVSFPPPHPTFGSAF